jgi:hypothetical protein
LLSTAGRLSKGEEDAVARALRLVEEACSELGVVGAPNQVNPNNPPPPHLLWIKNLYHNDYFASVFSSLSNSLSVVYRKLPAFDPFSSPSPPPPFYFSLSLSFFLSCYIFLFLYQDRASKFVKYILLHPLLLERTAKHAPTILALR